MINIRRNCWLAGQKFSTRRSDGLDGLVVNNKRNRGQGGLVMSTLLAMPCSMNSHPPIFILDIPQVEY